ncbi:ParB N-terminal domain-containing protein [Kribbella sp. NPDC050820]|uniref:ParB/RepB/Spo0J family partition protein n=1 Tax=Kribbella sp. NPDC050820 TaxID=3155408 RepID=UPI0033CD2483
MVESGQEYPESPAAGHGVPNLTTARLLPGELELAEITASDSPRLRGIDPDHVRLLAEFGGELPPIVVHAETHRVIDGEHRVEAARRRGDTTIAVLWFHGDEQVAFVLAVEANNSHGLPLSLADRRAAAVRIFTAFPQWSDRRLAAVCGLSASTVAHLRRRLQVADGPEPRIGRDGRVRPTDGGARRLKASEIFRSNPDATLRQVAAAAGISVGTARDVKERLRRGAHPVPRAVRGAVSGDADLAPDLMPDHDAPEDPVQVFIDGCERGRLLETLCNDPSVRFTESGRHLLRWLRGRASGVDGWLQALSGLEPHCDFVLAKLARTVSNEWALLATVVEERARNRADEPSDERPHSDSRSPVAGPRADHGSQSRYRTSGRA